MILIKREKFPSYIACRKSFTCCQQQIIIIDLDTESMTHVTIVFIMVHVIMPLR